MHTSGLLILILYVTVVLAHLKVGPYNPALKNIGAKPSSASLKRAGLTSPFIFTYISTTPSNVQDCFEYAGNEILAKLIDFQFSVKVTILKNGKKLN